MTRTSSAGSSSRKGAQIINSTVRGPAIIGERTRIENSYVGPYTSIHHDCAITGSEIEHSVILENCRITDIGYRIEDSLIGRNVEITQVPDQAPRLPHGRGRLQQGGCLVAGIPW